MRRGRMLILVAIVLLLGVAAAFLVVRRLSERRHTGVTGPRRRPISDRS